MEYQMLLLSWRFMTFSYEKTDHGQEMIFQSHSY